MQVPCEELVGLLKTKYVTECIKWMSKMHSYNSNDNKPIILFNNKLNQNNWKLIYLLKMFCQVFVILIFKVSLFHLGNTTIAEEQISSIICFNVLTEQLQETITGSSQDGKR